MAIRRAGHSIAYADGAIGYTEAPDTFRALAKQRFRWSFGTLQCAWKYRSTMFNARYGSLGFAALPNTWLFQLLLPALSPLADLAFVYSLLSIALTRSEHGNTFAMASMAHVFTYYAVFLLVDWLAAAIAFLMEPGEDKSLTWLILIQRFAYRQLMYWVVVRSFKAAFVGRFVGWGKLERKATVQIARRILARSRPPWRSRLPLFPLPLVLFPGAHRPLHIYEPRYRTMLADCLAGDRSFGVLFRPEGVRRARDPGAAMSGASPRSSAPKPYRTAAPTS